MQGQALVKRVTTDEQRARDVQKVLGKNHALAVTEIRIGQVDS